MKNLAKLFIQIVIYFLFTYFLYYYCFNIHKSASN